MTNMACMTTKPETSTVTYEDLCDAVCHGIGPDAINTFMQWDYCEYDGDYFGFLNTYGALKAPNTYTIIDIGCYLAAQAWLFRNNTAYIGIDIGVPMRYRLAQNNARHFDMTGQTFINDVLPDMIANGEIDLEHTIAICSAVPNNELQQQVIKAFPYHVVTYPCDIIDVALPSDAQWQPIDLD